MPLARSSYCGMLNSADSPVAGAATPAGADDGGTAVDWARSADDAITPPAASAKVVSAWRRVTRGGSGVGIKGGIGLPSRAGEQRETGGRSRGGRGAPTAQARRAVVKKS